MPPPSPEYCLLWIDHWSTCMQKSEWASWVQAVFSVVAICAAIGIAAWQRHQERMREVDRERAVAQRQMAVVTALADYACNRIDTLPDEGCSDDDAEHFYRTSDDRVFIAIADALGRIGPGDVPHGRVMPHILGIIRCLDDAAQFRSVIRIESWKSAAEQVYDTKQLADVSRRMLRRMAEEFH